MTVAIVDTPSNTTTGATATTGTTITLTTLTITTSNCIVAGFLVSSGASNPATVGVTWDSQSLSLIGSKSLATGQNLYWFGAIGAAVTGHTGNKSLVGTITGGGTLVDMYLWGQGLSGAVSFQNFTSAGPTTSAGPQNLAVTSDANSIVYAGWYNEGGAAQFAVGTSSPNAGTERWQQAGFTSNIEAQSATGAATQTMQASTGATSESWIAAGFSVSASGGGPTPGSMAPCHPGVFSMGAGCAGLIRAARAMERNRVTTRRGLIRGLLN